MRKKESTNRHCLGNVLKFFATTTASWRSSKETEATAMLAPECTKSNENVRQKKKLRACALQLKTYTQTPNETNLPFVFASIASFRFFSLSISVPFNSCVSFTCHCCSRAPWKIANAAYEWQRECIWALWLHCDPKCNHGIINVAPNTSECASAEGV